MISGPIRWASLASLLCVAGCGFQNFVHNEVLQGPYRLVAEDISEDMSLCRSVGEEGDCVGDSLPGPTVFQAGANSQYIVLARHARRQWDKPPDRSVTEFYYILLQNALVRGPFNEHEYQAEKRRLQLPEFSRVFSDLK
jgi:hypothetical protein